MNIIACSKSDVAARWRKFTGAKIAHLVRHRFKHVVTKIVLGLLSQMFFQSKRGV